jgi:acyl-CoA synthetase (AMP-forming)/AMP-acid ligase II
VDLPLVVSILTRRGLLTPGSPIRVASQLAAIRRWGWTLAGELRQAAVRDPDRVAVVDDRHGEITYQVLLDRAERLARSMRTALGVRPGDRVGVLARNHSGLIEAAVAGAVLGVDTVLVNIGLSAAQLAAVAAEQELRVLLHDEEFAERTVGLPPTVRLVDGRAQEALVIGAPSGVLAPPEREGHTIVLTSGTTGTPKGARRRPPSGLGPLVSIIDRIPLHVGDRMLIAAPLFHTWGYAALQCAFALRGTVVLQRRFDPVATLKAVVRHDCGVLFAVPVMAQRMLEVPPLPHRPPWKVVAVSGSALPGDLAHRFMDRYGDVLYNLYGSTEVSWASIATPADLRAAPHTAGRPPFGTQVTILDRHGNPRPVGKVGRIFVRNEMLFEGYTSGDGRESHGGMLDTGDLGHVDREGRLFIDGRQDDMIVSGGENVFPSEVENLLAELPQVREVAVVGVPDREYGQRLAAYLVLYPAEQLDPEAVREYVRRYRARFSVPRDVYFVPYLPRNATGKVVTRELHRLMAR